MNNFSFEDHDLKIIFRKIFDALCYSGNQKPVNVLSPIIREFAPSGFANVKANKIVEGGSWRTGRAQSFSTNECLITIRITHFWPSINSPHPHYSISVILRDKTVYDKAGNALELYTADFDQGTSYSGTDFCDFCTTELIDGLNANALIILHQWKVQKERLLEHAKHIVSKYK